MEHYPRLARIKQKFDPGNLLRVNQNIKPASRSGMLPRRRPHQQRSDRDQLPHAIGLHVLAQPARDEFTALHHKIIVRQL